MIPEVEIMLCCARTCSTPQTSSRIKELATPNLDWHLFLQRATSHGVRPLVYHSFAYNLLGGIARSGAPPTELFLFCKFGQESVPGRRTASHTSIAPRIDHKYNYRYSLRIVVTKQSIRPGQLRPVASIPGPTVVQTCASSRCGGSSNRRFLT